MSTDGLKEGDELPNDKQPHNMLSGTLTQPYDIAAEEVRIVHRTEIKHDTEKGKLLLSKGLAFDLEDAYENPDPETKRPFAEIDEEDKTLQVKGAPVKYGLRYPPPHMVVSIWQFGFNEAEHWPWVNVVYKQQYFYGWKLIEENKIKMTESGVFPHQAYPSNELKDNINRGGPMCESIQTFEFKVEIVELTGDVTEDDIVVTLGFKGTGVETYNDTARFTMSGGPFQFTRWGGEDNFCYDVINDRYHTRTMSAVIYGEVYKEGARDKNLGGQPPRPLPPPPAPLLPP